MEKKKAGREGVRQTQAFSDSRWFHVHRSLCGRGSRPLGSDAREQRVSSSGAPSTLDTLCFSTEQILTFPRGVQTQIRLPPTPGLTAPALCWSHVLAQLCVGSGAWPPLSADLAIFPIQGQLFRGSSLLFRHVIRIVLCPGVT